MLSMRNALGTLALASTLALGACSSSQEGSDQQSKASTASPMPSAPAATLTADQVNVKLTLQGEPVLTADGQNIAVTVDLANSGKTLWTSAGSNPVNLGAHSVDANGKIINNDLVHAALPDIAPGTSTAVTILLPVAGIVNESAQILPVQEGVAWFDTWGTKPLTVGPFNSCKNTAEGAICNADGKPLATTPAH